MKAEFLTTTRTARYFTLGELNERTQEIWLVLHGYAQLANEFLEDFRDFCDESKFIIAPEALNRFYIKGHSGKVGATWMTKEARDLDINDNVLYLDHLVREWKIEQKGAKLCVLGFSQGVATMTRWLHRSHIIPHGIIIYAGEIAHELQKKPLPVFFYKSRCYFIYGKNDPLLPAFAPDTLKELFGEIDLKTIEFDGGHEIRTDALRKVIL